jgi:hypothetical protein
MQSPYPRNFEQRLDPVTGFRLLPIRDRDFAFNITDL